MLDLTSLVLTCNEAPNIRRTLEQLRRIPHVLLLDSFSTDDSLEIARQFGNVEILQHRFDSFAAQCNFGLTHISTEWALSLDADYVLTPELVSEIENLEPAADIGGYSAEFRYCVFGGPLRSTVYPPRTVLYRRQLAHYGDEGHGHRVVVDGKILKLSGKIDHDDRKAFSHWLQSQGRYMKVEAPHLLATPDNQLRFQDRVRKKIFFAPPIMFLYLLFGRGLILDGWRGWFYVCQRTLVEMLLSIRLLIEKHQLEAGDQ